MVLLNDLNRGAKTLDWQIKKFEELKCEDLYKILKIRNDVFIVEQHCVYQDCDDKDKYSYHLYLEEHGKIISYLRILNKGVSYNEVSIGRVLVNKDYRGKGIAKEIMIRAINFIEQDLKETEIRIQAQAYLLNFYKNLGFTEVSEAYLEDNIPHIDMLYKK